MMQAAFLLLTLLLFCSPALAIDGPPVPKPGEPAYDNAPADLREMFDAMESVCAIGYLWNMSDGTLCSNGREHSNSGTGLLVAPNIVITDSHVLRSITSPNVNHVPWDPSPNGVVVQDWDCGNGPQPRLVVRFRKNPSGSYGSKEQGWESYFQVPVKRVIWAMFPKTNAQNGVVIGCPDRAILVLSDGPNDPGFESGWITHLQSVPLSAAPQRPIKHSFQQVFAPGWGQRWQDDPNVPSAQTTGVLRFASTTNTYGAYSQECDGPVFLPGIRRVDGDGGQFSDSGRPVLFRTGDGVIAAEHYTGLSHKDIIKNVWLPFSQDWFVESQFDLTGSLDPSDPTYGIPDLTHSLEDVVFALLQSLRSDWSDWASDLLFGPNPYNQSPLIPLHPGVTDINGDGRFNQLDVYEQIAGGNNAVDFDGDGQITSTDSNVLIALMSPLGSSNPATFGHGVAGDLDGDSQFTQIDRLAILDLVQATPDLFTGVYLTGDQHYRVELDVDLDGCLSYNDYRILMPLDVNSTGGAIRYETPTPDGRIDRWDVLKLMHQYSLAGSARSWADLNSDGVIDAKDVVELAYQRLPFVIQTNQPFNWGIDANGDNRLNYADVQFISAAADTATYLPDWDLDADGLTTDTDARILWDLLFGPGGGIPFNHGVLGDIDLSQSPHCRCPDGNGSFWLPAPTWLFCYDQEPLCDWNPTLFADCGDLPLLSGFPGPDPFSNRVFGDGMYRFDLDWNLDGVNDFDDYVAIFGMIEPADQFHPDGVLDSNDQDAYLVAFQNQWASADLAAPFGVINIFDLLEFFRIYDNGTGLCN